MTSRLAILLFCLLGLAGCSFSEAQISQERDQASAECASQSGTAPFGKPSARTLCVRAALTRIRATNDASSCRSKGLLPGTPGMEQCVARLDQARRAQVISDYDGYAAQMRR